MVLVLFVTFAAIAGVIWFAVSSKDDSASASKSTTTTAASALSTTTTPVSGLLTTSSPDHGLGAGQIKIPQVTPTLPAKATGSDAQLCSLAGQYRQAVATFAHAKDTGRSVDAERVAEQVLPTFDQLAKAAPASVYEAVRRDYNIVATIATTSESAAALEKVAPGMGLPQDQEDMISSHYLIVAGDLSRSVDGKTLAAFFDTCG